MSAGIALLCLMRQLARVGCHERQAPYSSRSASAPVANPWPGSNTCSVPGYGRSISPDTIVGAAQTVPRPARRSRPERPGAVPHALPKSEVNSDTKGSMTEPPLDRLPCPPSVRQRRRNGSTVTEADAAPSQTWRRHRYRSGGDGTRNVARRPSLTVEAQNVPSEGAGATKRTDREPEPGHRRRDRRRRTGPPPTISKGPPAGERMPGADHRSRMAPGRSRVRSADQRDGGPCSVTRYGGAGQPVGL